MRKPAAVLLIIAMLLFSGCADSIIVKVAVDGEVTKPAITERESGGGSSSAMPTHKIEYIYSGGNPAFKVDDRVKDSLSEFIVIDYIESSGDFLYIYSGVLSASANTESNAYQNYYVCFAAYNINTKKYKKIYGFEIGSYDGPPSLHYAEGYNKCYFVQLSGKLLYYQYSSGVIAVYVFPKQMAEIYAALRDAYNGQKATPHECVGLYPANKEKGVYVCYMLYEENYTSDDIDSEEIEDDSESLFKNVVYGLYYADFDSPYEKSGPVEKLPDGTSFYNSCTFPSNGARIYSEGNSYYYQHGSIQSAIGSNPSEDVNVTAYSSNGGNYFVRFKEDYAAISKFENEYGSDGSPVSVNITYSGSIYKNIYTTVTNHQIYVKDDSEFYAAALDGIYNKNSSRTKEGYYYALFRYSADKVIAVGYSGKIGTKITSYNSKGEVISTQTSTKEPELTDIANARYFVYNISEIS